MFKLQLSARTQMSFPIPFAPDILTRFKVAKGKYVLIYAAKQQFSVENSVAL